MSRKKQQQPEIESKQRTTPPDSAETIVIGDGWAALGAVGFLAQASKDVLWIPGTGSRLIAPLPTLESGTGARAWALLAERLGVFGPGDAGQPEPGSYLREFRNKAFREPSWTKAPTPEARREVRAEEIWGAETSIASVFESRLKLGLGELEEQVRANLAAVRRLDDEVPVQGFSVEDGRVTAVILGSGVRIACSRVIYADRWSQLPALEGLPKPLPFLRRREAMAALQVAFRHDPFVGADLLEGFYGPIQREAGEEEQRHVWGWFSSDGSRSLWTVVLGANQVEDNHEIAKKLRRMKQALDKMFVGEGWLKAGQPDFLSTVKDEQVRFEESVLFSSGETPTEPARLPKLGGIEFLTDGYGPAAALEQVASALGLTPELVIASEGEEPSESGEPVASRDVEPMAEGGPDS